MSRREGEEEEEEEEEEERRAQPMHSLSIEDLLPSRDTESSGEARNSRSPREYTQSAFCVCNVWWVARRRDDVPCF